MLYLQKQKLKDMNKELENFRKNVKKMNLFVPFHLYPYEFVGYVAGNKVDKGESIDIHFFDKVNIIKESVNVRDGKKFVHAIAYFNAVPYFVVLKYKEDGI